MNLLYVFIPNLGDNLNMKVRKGGGELTARTGMMSTVNLRVKSAGIFF